MKIGVFGGCFNPPHTSHKRIAKKLILKGYVDKIVFVPTSSSYAKRGLVPFEHRVRMLEEMTKDDENMDISTISAKGYEYTYQVLDALQDIHPDDQLFFICGTDNLAELDTWKKYEYIISEYGILAVQRNGDDIETIAKKYERHKSGIIVTDVESGALSSTLIRRSLATNDIESISDHLDSAVLDYILKYDLYRKEGKIQMKEVVEKLKKAGKTISTMESCTGGGVANALTDIEGASEVLKFSAVTYSNEFKIKMGVDAKVIDEYSVYSIETAHEMSRRISMFTDSDYGVGITGKLNRVDVNNLTGNDNEVFVSIYTKDTDSFDDITLKVNETGRKENKNTVIRKIAERLSEII